MFTRSHILDESGRIIETATFGLMSVLPVRKVQEAKPAETRQRRILKIVKNLGTG